VAETNPIGGKPQKWCAKLFSNFVIANYCCVTTDWKHTTSVVFIRGFTVNSQLFVRVCPNALP